MSDCTEKDLDIEQLQLKILLLQKELECLRNDKLRVKIDASTQYESLNLVDEFHLYKECTGGSEKSISDMIRETSENCLSNSGYSYEEKTGLYYHSKSGYYYDPNSKLYFDPKSGCYYSYDTDSGEYKYHSKEDLQHLSELKQELLWSQGYQHKVPKISPSNQSVFIEHEQYQAAPGLRIINEKTGHLFIITCTGGSFGSDNNIDYSVHVNAREIGDICLKIFYDKLNKQFNVYCDKCDSSPGASMLNGSIINRIPMPICHHSNLVIENDRFLLHVHENNETCDWCEPGQVKSKLTTETNRSINETEINKESHDIRNHRNMSRQVVNQLKIKYGLKSGRGAMYGGGFKNHSKVPLENYIDRAQMRRDKEKQEEEYRKKESRNKNTGNVALNMMTKMGWNPGESLGKTGTGITEPIEVCQRLSGRVGIGCPDSISIHIGENEKVSRKLTNLSKTINRFNSAL